MTRLDGSVFLKLLIALRSAGALAFAAPGVGAEVLEVPNDQNNRYLIRIFAARNVSMVLGVLFTSGKARRDWLRAGIVCDALDVGAAVMGAVDGMGKSKAAREGGLSLLAAALGVLTLRSIPIEAHP